jgi:hypothetical protein
VNNIVVCFCLTVMLAGFLWLGHWPVVPTIDGQDPWPAATMAGGLFTIAIAVLVRD